MQVPDSACPANHAAATAPTNTCVAAGGTCRLMTDGYYGLSYTSIALGIFLGLWYARLAPRLQALPPDAWRAKPGRKAN